MIDTNGTRYKIETYSKDVWIFAGWKDFLKECGLDKFMSFMELTGVVVDRNRRSVVYQLELGKKKRRFYLKIHKNYIKKDIRTFFKAVPQILTELKNLMHYARIGFDVLEPVAWGWHPAPKEGDSFLLVEELNGYRSLQEWLEDKEYDTMQREISEALAVMLAKIHTHGLAHVDLFSWHVFLKKEQSVFTAIPIDLERTKIKGRWPWSPVKIAWKQANDLAALHLTVPWPQVGSWQRLRFYARYCQLTGGLRAKQKYLEKILHIARKRGVHKKFEKFGVSRNCLQQSR